MSLAATAIITKGLTCGTTPGTICQTGLITSHFSLYCREEVVTTITGGGGGPYPKQAWNKFSPGEIKNFYKPVQIDQPFYLLPVEQQQKLLQKKQVVVLKIAFGTNIVEKEYAVPVKKAKLIVKVFNVIQVAANGIKTVISNINTKWTNIKVKVGKVKTRDE